MNTWRWLTLLAILPALPVAAQTEGTSEARSPAGEIGMFVFPKDKQNAEQQKKDETECYAAAQQQSGFDPRTPAPKGPTAAQQQRAAQEAAANAQQSSGGRARGAAKGAAAGAVAGAILGRPGAGAGVGAVAGTASGGSRQRQANEAAQQQAAADAVARQKQAAARKKAAYEEELDGFKRAFGACLDARGYSVK